MLQRIAMNTGQWVIETINVLFHLNILFYRTILMLTRIPFRLREIVQQLYELGNKSVNVIVFAVTFAGIVVAIEYIYHMRLVLNSAEMVPAFSAVMVVRELGPTLTALILATKVGAGIAAEIGLMKITEQIDALRLLRINPIEFLVLPRFVASIIATVYIFFNYVHAIVAMNFIKLMNAKTNNHS